MRRILLLAALVIVFNALIVSQALCNGAEKNEMSPAAIAVRPALVRIQVVITDYDQGRESRSLASGSGVIISPEGYVVTNYHVTDFSKQITCTLADKTKVDAKLIAADPLADISVIKLDNAQKISFPFADFGDSSKLEVGDRIYAMAVHLQSHNQLLWGL